MQLGIVMMNDDDKTARYHSLTSFSISHWQSEPHIIHIEVNGWMISLPFVGYLPGYRQTENRRCRCRSIWSVDVYRKLHPGTSHILEVQTVNAFQSGLEVVDVSHSGCTYSFRAILIHRSLRPLGSSWVILVGS